jgi:hypothetical protein
MSGELPSALRAVCPPTRLARVKYFDRLLSAAGPFRTRYPIYDQHVHRAMAFMQGGHEWEIPYYNPTKVRSYLGSYVPFFDSFAPIERRRVDRALWAFGKFLATPYGEAL